MMDEDTDCLPRTTILYVDDEAVLLESVKSYLEHHESFSVDTAGSAEEALGLLKNGSYDAVISDYHMPGTSGLAFLRLLRESGNDVPFIIFTGRGREDIVVDAYNAGADSYLIKGGDPRLLFLDLARTVRQVVANRRMEQELHYKNTLLAMQQEVIPDGVVVVGNNGTIVSCNRQFSMLWDLPHDSCTGASWEDLLAELNKKTADPGQSPLIFADSSPSAGMFRSEFSLCDGRTFDYFSAPLAGPDGRSFGRIRHFRDITEQKRSREALMAARDSLEQKVYERTHELTSANLALREEIARRIEAEAGTSASLREKEILLREIHHRVKNNLQVIVSLLNLQSRSIQDEQVLAAIRNSQSRVRAIALVHEKLYRSTGLSGIELGGYLQYLAESLLRFYSVEPGTIALSVNAGPHIVGIDQAVPLGLVINELLTNAIKYAFPDGRKGTLSISAEPCPQGIVLTIEDDGPGLPAGLDWKSTESLGLQLVISLVDQLEGEIDLLPGPGTRYRIAMPIRPVC